MSIGLLKRLLTLTKIAALLILAGAAYGYWDHREAMQNPWSSPEFSPEVVSIGATAPQVTDVAIPLGLLPKEEEAAPVPEKVEEQPRIEGVLARLGKIKHAVVFPPPYTGTSRPAITFELNEPAPDGSKIRTIRLGEAIEERVDPKYGKFFPVPYRYKFVGCEDDPEHPGWTYFLFDMKCDGTDIQKAHWKGEEPAEHTPTAPKPGEAQVVVPSTVATSHAFVGSRSDVAKPADASKSASPADKPQTAPKPVEPRADESALNGPIFEQDPQGTFIPTSASVAFLERNHQKLIKDAETRTYRDPRTRRPAGVRIVRFRKGSRVNQFGIREDDVIQAINDRPVTRQAQAINIVKEELKKPNMHIIRVQILRNGRKLTMRFDTRDRNTRRAAREAFRGRR